MKTFDIHCKVGDHVLKEAKADEMLEMLKELVAQLDNYSQVYGYDESKLVGKAEQLIKSIES